MDWDDIFSTRASRVKASEIRELLKLLAQPDIISFAGGIPDPDLFPAEEFQAAFADIFASGQQDEALQYSVSEGYAPLREWLTNEMSKLGIPCDVDNVLITSGSQQALDYLGKLFLSPGDTALVNWPTYIGALSAYNAYEPNYDRLLTGGNRTAEAYREQAKEKGGRVKFAYMSADFSNPTGETMNRAERLALLDLAKELEIAIIEDGAYQSLRYDGEVIPPILALEIEQVGTIEDARTVYCGTFSKTLAPGLRVGWVCAAKSVISKLVLIKQASDLHSPTMNQIATEKVASAGFDAQVAKIRVAYKNRRDATLNALKKYMPDGVRWTQPEGGMFIWVTLPDHIDGTDLLAKSIKNHKVAFVPGQAFFADRSGQNTIRLSFSKNDEAVTEEGIRRLGDLIRSE